MLWPNRSVLTSVLLGMLLLARGTPAAAQVAARSFEQLPAVVGVGDTVRVIDTSGREVTGSIADLSPTRLTLVVQSGRETFPEDAVSRILHRRGDSLADGALWGFGIGAGFWGAALLTNPDGADAGWFALGMAMFGGIGAGIGVGVDAMIQREQPIYERARSGGLEFRMAPIHSRARRGLVVVLRF